MKIVAENLATGMCGLHFRQLVVFSGARRIVEPSIGEPESIRTLWQSQRAERSDSPTRVDSLMTRSPTDWFKRRSTELEYAARLWLQLNDALEA